MKTVIQPDDSAIQEYHKRLDKGREGRDTTHEGNIRHAFANLLEATARKRDWKHGFQKISYPVGTCH